MVPIVLTDEGIERIAARMQALAKNERDGSQEPRGPWPSGLRPARRRRSPGALKAVVLSSVAAVVALGALLSLMVTR